MFETAILDGAPVSVRDLRLHDFTSGFFFGAGLFETLRVRRGQIEFLERHLARMTRSLGALEAVGRPKDEHLDPEAIRRCAKSALAALPGGDPERDCVMKIAVSDGHALITFRDLPAPRVAQIHDTLASYRSGDLLTRHKTLSYLRQYASMTRPVLFANERNEICEGPTSNVFVQTDDGIVTPPLDAPCLPGIVREVLLARSAAGDLPIREERVDLDTLRRARACVLTNSVSIATAVTRLLGRDLEGSLALAERVGAVIAAAPDRVPHDHLQGERR